MITASDLLWRVYYPRGFWCYTKTEAEAKSITGANAGWRIESPRSFTGLQEIPAANAGESDVQADGVVGTPEAAQ